MKNVIEFYFLLNSVPKRLYSFILFSIKQALNFRYRFCNFLLCNSLQIWLIFYYLDKFFFFCYPLLLLKYNCQFHCYIWVGGTHYISSSMFSTLVGNTQYMWFAFYVWVCDTHKLFLNSIKALYV